MATAKPAASRLSGASTVTITGLAENSALRLRTGQIVRNVLGGQAYRVEGFLGKGGFGAAYRAVQVAGPRPVGACVLKVTTHAPSWHREAYFGYLLRDSPGLVNVYESFAWMPPGENRAPLYSLISEFIEEGDLGHYLERHPQPWPEAHARREIIRLLRAATLLHESGAVHRDITPANVFVTAKRELRLGDFGIALHRAGTREVAADVFAPRFAPKAIRERKVKSWRQSDDVSQIGQLYAALLCGTGARKLTPPEVKNLPCTAHAKSILQRCIGERRKCFANASEMLKALEKRASETATGVRLRSLAGKRIVFTGELSILRAEARKLARKTGAIVETSVGSLTDAVVEGKQSPNWKATNKGQKLLDVDRERERGHAIAIVNEARFLKLVGR